jgi:outer membrane protein OmpA-like peptidoglycan-associated protein
MPPAAASDTVSDAVPDGNRRGSLFVMALVAGLVALIGAVAIVIWFATRPAAPPPQPLPAPLLPVPASPSTPATGTQAGRAAGEEPSGEVARPADAAPVATVPGSAPAAGQALGPAEPFPAHFRENTALFWFDDDQTRDGFLARVSAVKPASTLRLVGHATEGEAAAGRGSLGLSRAWAVRRWLIRQGIDDGRIETERGRNVPDRGPHDTRGLALNHRVDITVE